jgi:hypothetical protein
MNPDELPSQTQTTRSLRVLPSLPPKRRSKAGGVAPDEGDPSSVIIPFYDPAPKPAKFHRSAEPFQVWKEPTAHRHDPAPRKPDLRTAISESVQAYARSMAFLLAWRLDHSP